MTATLQGYHAHIYFDESTRLLADHLREQALRELAPQGAFVSRLIPRPIGPHPVGMFEVNFGVDQHSAFLAWFQQKRGRLTVMIHEVTGDDWRDHQAPQWLGEPLLLDLSKMDPNKPTVVRKT
ncbi:MAG: DOPA 4,5-dioxygenase family protein [Bdellovibrionales bacterium]|nr:DOPA 4,5-dioxygenase family protein [Bdellovibrionales bacterium]